MESEPRERSMNAEASKSAVINRDDERLTDDQGRLVGWISDIGPKFHPCGASLTAEQLRAILAMLDAAAP